MKRGWHGEREKSRSRRAVGELRQRWQGIKKIRIFLFSAVGVLGFSFSRRDLVPRAELFTLRQRFFKHFALEANCLLAQRGPFTRHRRYIGDDAQDCAPIRSRQAAKGLSDLRGSTKNDANHYFRPAKAC
jgi:hypothetical protein